MKRFNQSITVNLGIILALGVGASSLSSAAHADKIIDKPSNYAMHLDEIGPAPAIGQSTRALKIKLQSDKGSVLGMDEHW